MKKLYDILCAFIFLSVLCAAFIIPKQISSLTIKALELCTKTVIPSLFPFTVATRILSLTGASVYAGRALSFIITPFIGIPKQLCGAFLTGLFGGFPNGAHAVGTVYKTGLCTKTEAERCIALSNNCSVPFVLSVAGISALGSVRYGIILLASQLICIIITSLLLNIMFGKLQSSSISQARIFPDIKFKSAICKAIPSSCIIMLNVCGFVTVFYVISGIVTANLFNSRAIDTLIKGFLEISCGIDSVKATGYPLNFILCSAIVGFSGISVIFQVTEASEGYGISCRQFLVTRLINAVLMPVITAVIMLAVPGRYIQAFSYNDYSKYASQPVLSTVMLLYALYFTIVMSVFALLYITVSKLDKKKTQRFK